LRFVPPRPFSFFFPFHTINFLRATPRPLFSFLLPSLFFIPRPAYLCIFIPCPLRFFFPNHLLFLSLPPVNFFLFLFTCLSPFELVSLDFSLVVHLFLFHCTSLLLPVVLTFPPQSPRHSDFLYYFLHLFRCPTMAQRVNFFLLRFTLFFLNLIFFPPLVAPNLWSRDLLPLLLFSLSGVS